jgi:hypothetical protein
VFVVAVVESKARKAWRSDRNKMSGVIAAATWVTIFVLCGVVVYAWFWVNRPPFVLTGSVQNLHGAESIGSKELYSVPEYYDRQRDIFNIKWAFVTTSLKPEGQTLTFRFFRTANEDGIPYQLTISPELYRTQIDLQAVGEGSDRKLSVTGHLKGVALEVTSDSHREYRTPGLLAGSTVYAQSQSSMASLLGRLESYDPLVRRDARDELAKRGPAALPDIEKVLVGNKSSYRLRLGIIDALNKMQGLTADSLSSEAYSAIVRAQNDPDPTLSDQASRFVKRYPRPVKGKTGSGGRGEVTRKQK